MNPLSDEKLLLLFKPSVRNQALISTNESATVEFKESFGWKSLPKYLKSMASFANRSGGYLIFGIKDKPRLLSGLAQESLKQFEGIDGEQWTTNLREYFSPEIIWEKSTFDVKGKTFGIIYTYQAYEKPVICKKNAGDLRKAAIYYRYNSQNSEIDYPDLALMIKREKDKINAEWMKRVKLLGSKGISKTALLDLNAKTLATTNSTLYIDSDLAKTLSFVQEGKFVENEGNPTLVLKGEVETISGAQKVIIERKKPKAINFDEIINSFLDQEDVVSPEEYIKQICYQNSGMLPFYYYLKLSSLNTSDAISLVNSVPCSSKSKDKLLEKMQAQDFTLFTDFIASEAGKNKRYYAKKILANNYIIPNEIKDIRYFVQSIRTIDKYKVLRNKDTIFNVLKEIYTNYYYADLYKNIKIEIRNSICWIDEALYKTK